MLNKRKEKLVDVIFNVHKDLLSNISFAIILCGSGNTKRQLPISDIDYIVIVDKFDTRVSGMLGIARFELERRLRLSVSNSVQEFINLVNVDQIILSVDGKIVQALIESEGSDDRIRASFPYNLPEINPNAIQQFSKNNFFILQALLKKCLIRVTPNKSKASEHRHKLIKLCIVALKMYAQYYSPNEYVKTKSTVVDNPKLDNIRSLIEKLQLSKINYSQKTPDEVINYVCNVTLANF